MILGTLKCYYCSDRNNWQYSQGLLYIDNSILIVIDKPYDEERMIAFQYQHLDYLYALH